MKNLASFRPPSIEAGTEAASVIRTTYTTCSLGLMDVLQGVRLAPRVLQPKGSALGGEHGGPLTRGGYAGPLPLAFLLGILVLLGSLCSLEGVELVHL